jgi:hypothetical protein
MRVAVAAALFLALAAPASANQFQTLFNDFKGDGSINPCRYSAGELQKGASQVPPDIEQYAPSFADQLAAARQRSGGCGGSGSAPTERAAAAQPKAGSPGSGKRGGVSKPPAPKRSAEPTLAGVPTPQVSASVAGAAGGDPPAPVWILAGLAALAALAFVAGLALRASALGVERRARALGASADEARGRVADALAEFWDWLRLGR